MESLMILYKDEKLYWTYQHGIGWPDNYIGPDSMTHSIIEKSQEFTDVGLLRISEFYLHRHLIDLV